MENVAQSRRISPFWVVFGLVGFVNAAWWFILQMLPDHETGWNFWFNAVYAVPYLLGGFWLLWRVRNWKDLSAADGRAMAYLGLGIVSHGIAQCIWTYYNVILHIDAPSSSYADIFYTAAVILQIFGALVLLVHRPGKQTKPLQQRLRIFVAIALMSVLSFLIVRVIFSSEEGFLLNINTFYTATSFLRAFLFVLNIYRERHFELRAFLFTQLVGATLLDAADAVYGIQSFSGAYWNGNLADLFYMLAGLVAFATVHFLPAVIWHEEREDETARGLRLEAILPVSVILLGLIVAGRAAESAYTTALSQIQLETEHEASQIATLVKVTLVEEVTHLNGLSALFGSGFGVTEDEFQSYVTSIEKNNPRVSEFGFIDPDGILIYTTQQGRKGYDIAKDPVRSPLLARARDTDTFAASAPVYLLQGTPGVLLYKPVYRQGVFIGTATASIHLERFFDSISAIVSEENVNLMFESDGIIIDPSGRSIYNEEGMAIDRTGSVANQVTYLFPPAAPVEVTQTVPVDGVDWILTVSPTRIRAERAYGDPTSAFLIVSLSFAALSGLLFITISQQSRMREQLRERTRTLRDNIHELQQSKFFLDNVTDGVVAADVHGMVEYVNDSAAHVLDMRAERMLEHNFSFIFSDLGIPFQEIQAKLDAQGNWEGELRHDLSAGMGRDLYLSVSALQEPKKGIVGYLLVARDITARRDVERSKNQFVSLVSHQLRAPMTQLRWMAESLLENRKLAKSLREQLESMEQIISAENKLVGDLLNVSRIERGVLKLDIADAPVKRVIANAVKSLELLARNRRIQIRQVDVPANLFVRVDLEKIAEALRNIIDNAIKYSPEHSTITVHAVPADAKTVEISVVDQGPGIPEELWGKLFEVKTAPTTTGEQTSAGLGLYLTKKFIEAVGGTVRFDTSHQGTIFYVRLPRARNRG
jgi:PAS domain S-box-containing protein